MKLLLLNGNTDAEMTARLTEAARGLCPHDITPATARFGARYIATRAASAIAAHAVLDALAEWVGPQNPQGFDAVVIGCFGDPGIEAAREMLNIPVLGLADASIQAALKIAPVAALLTGGVAWVPMLEEFCLLRGHDRRSIRVAAVTPTGDMIAREPDRALALLAEAARAEVKQGAGVVVLGGAGLVGLAPRLQPMVSVPVLDCLQATLGMLDQARPGMVAMQAAPSVGLSVELAGMLAGEK